MGEVYLADDTRLQRQVALKFLPESVRNAPESLARFRREALAAASLKHPNIATVYALEDFDGVTFIFLFLNACICIQMREYNVPITEGHVLGHTHIEDTSCL